MAKIERSGLRDVIQVRDTKMNRKQEVQQAFKNKLVEIEQAQIRERLEGLFDRIVNQTNKLQDRLFIEDLVQYKKLVKEFLDVSVHNSHVFYKENSLDRRGRHRVYSLVKRVDKELDQLTKDFLDIEKNRIRILQRLDDIKGMLLDVLT